MRCVVSRVLGVALLFVRFFVVLCFIVRVACVVVVSCLFGFILLCVKLWLRLLLCCFADAWCCIGGCWFCRGVC